MGAAGIVAIVLLTALLLVRKPSPPSGLENGDFANDCCGSLTLREGQIILNGKSATSYTIGHDADGFYILPRNYVGGFDEIGFEIDGSRAAARSHIAYRTSHPKSLLVPGGSKTYRFKRRLPVGPSASPFLHELATNQ
jgi:hypothetical protein